MRLKKFIKRFLSPRPEIFFTIAFLFFLTGALAIFDPLMKEINPTLSLNFITVFVWFFGLISFYLGLKYSFLLTKIRKLLVLLIFVLTTIALIYGLGWEWFIAIPLNFLVFMVCFTFFRLKNNFIYLFFIGAVIFVLNLFIMGVPLLKPLLHYELTKIINPLFVIGLYLMLFSFVRLYTQDKKIGRITFLLLLLLVILSTYRSYVGIVTLTWLFLELKSLKKNRKSIFNGKAMFFWSIAIIFMFTIFGLIGYLLQTTKIIWKLDPLRSFEYRIAFTTHIFNGLVERSFPLGYSFGKTLILTEPGKYVCNLYNCTTRLTSTIMGEVMLDFGLIGVFITMFIIGAIVQSFYKKDYAIFSLLIAHLIAVIEIGANILILSLFVYIWYWSVEKWKLKRLG